MVSINHTLITLKLFLSITSVRLLNLEWLSDQGLINSIYDVNHRTRNF